MRSWRTICECETVAVGTERGGGEGIGQDLIGDRIGLKPYLLSERQLQRGQNFGYQFFGQFLAECEESTPRPGHTHRTPFRKVSLPPVSVLVLVVLQDRCHGPGRLPGLRQVSYRGTLERKIPCALG